MMTGSPNKQYNRAMIITNLIFVCQPPPNKQEAPSALKTTLNIMALIRGAIFVNIVFQHN